MTAEDVLLDDSHQLLLRSLNRDTGRYDVQERVEERGLVDASDTLPEDDTNTEYNWISETFYRKSYDDEECAGTEQLAEQENLLYTVEDDFFQKGGGESPTGSMNVDVDACSNLAGSPRAATTSNITNVECVPLEVVQSATSTGNNCLKLLLIIILRSMNL